MTNFRIYTNIALPTVHLEIVKMKLKIQRRLKWFYNLEYARANKIEIAALWDFHCSKIWRLTKFSYILDRNELEVITSIMVIQVNDMVLKIETAANKPTEYFPPISMANMNSIQILTSKRNEQNCPKKVMAFVLFLCLITVGSNSRRSLSLLSWRYIKRNKMI